MWTTRRRETSKLRSSPFCLLPVVDHELYAPRAAVFNLLLSVASQNLRPAIANAVAGIGIVSIGGPCESLPSGVSVPFLLQFSVHVRKESEYYSGLQMRFHLAGLSRLGTFVLITADPELPRPAPPQFTNTGKSLRW